MMKTLSPGSTIGILGGGQLGRMLAIAAAQLGYKTHIYCPEKNNPAEQVSCLTTHAEYDDVQALAQFARTVDVVTYEFENIPVRTVEYISTEVLVFPNARVLQVSQDRLREKEFINSLTIETAPYSKVGNKNDIIRSLKTLSYPAVLKTRQFGYDGKGQYIIKQQKDIEVALSALGGDQLILEGFIDFDLEISVLVARGQDGSTQCYDPVENKHKNHILDISIAPARVAEEIKKMAVAQATKIVNALEYVGVMAVEFFVSAQNPKLRVNEVAPRVHNSGHWTIEACNTSQFEQHIRAICGLPLGNPDMRGEAVMINLIGDDILQYEELLKDPLANVHHYGKCTIRPGRKMGHVTRVFTEN
jgi:5-(carboxyamino)imidazole ribonucleotide synthase